MIEYLNNVINWVLGLTISYISLIILISVTMNIAKEKMEIIEPLDKAKQMAMRYIGIIIFILSASGVAKFIVAVFR